MIRPFVTAYTHVGDRIGLEVHTTRVARTVIGLKLVWVNTPAEALGSTVNNERLSKPCKDEICL